MNSQPDATLFEIFGAAHREIFAVGAICGGT
jgi:hypothetical protein